MQEYLQQEEISHTKNEYVNGQIIPMVGGNTNHNQISGNITAELNFAFKKRDYLVYMGDVRLWIDSDRKFTYPDVMIVAGNPLYLEQRNDTIINPIAIMEVLSKSTQEYDKQGKFAAYRTIPTLQEYILISQTQVKIEQYLKLEAKRWSFQEYDEADQVIKLNSVGLELPLVDIYSKVNFKD